MPAASYSPNKPVEGFEQAAALLRSNGLRLSSSRRIVLEGLLQAEGPISADFLASDRGCDLPTAYRNLDLFERLGMVRHVHIGHGPGLYALVGDEDPTYLVCEGCGRVDRLPLGDVESVRKRIAGSTGFEAHFTHFPILGLCSGCAGEDAHERAAHTHEHSHGAYLHSHPHSHGEPESRHGHTHD